jgi:hypothetical protein
VNVLIVSAEMQAAIDAINASITGRRIEPQTADDGVTRFLNADLLDDCNEGQTWAEFREHLHQFEISEALLMNPNVSIGNRLAINTPHIDSLFQQAVASWTLRKHWSFGSAASQGTPIRNAANLAQYFNPYADFAGEVTINSELQRYQRFNSAENFVFQSDRLELTGTLGAGASVVPTVVASPTGGVNLDGTATPIGQLGLATTAGITVGQVVAYEYSGLYYVSALVPDVSVTLSPLHGSPTGFQWNQLLVFLPYYTAESNAAFNGGATQISFASLPAGVVAGMQWSVSDGSNAWLASEHKVLSRAGNTVTLDRPNAHGNVGSGTRMFFTPTIKSAQIWSKDYLSPVHYPTRVVALELRCKMPASSPPARLGFNTKAAFDALPAGAPWGAWPAFWLYSGNSVPGAYRDNSEIDIVETWNSATMDQRMYTGYSHGAVGDVFFKPNSNGSSWGAYDVLSRPTDMVDVDFGLVWADGRLWRYIDGVCVKCEFYDWTSLQKAQIGVNLAWGSITPAYAANLNLPFHNSNFPNSLGVKELKVWLA